MAIKSDIQVDFSGGEIGNRMIMREDTAVHAKSLLEMRNFIPTLQGTAVRTPGTKFIQTIGDTSTVQGARIIPYTLPNGAKALLLITPKVGATLGNINILANIGGAAGAPVQTLDYDKIIPHGDINSGLDGFIANPVDYHSSDGNTLGWTDDTKTELKLELRRGHHVPAGDPTTGVVSTPFVIPETTTNIIVAPMFFYARNGGNADYGITVVVKIGTTLNGAETATITVPELSVGGTPYEVQTVVTGTFTAGQTYYLTVTCTANAGPGGDGDARTKPVFIVTEMNVYSKVTVDIGSTVLTAVVPYTNAELQAVHYVQSPYVGATPLKPAIQGVGKEVVFTHPNHTPKRLYLKVGTYTFESIFTNNATQFHDQCEWTVNGYPATCGSFMGRLVLAGSSETGSTAYNGSSSETVWMTEVGDWGKFTDPALTEVVPTDSVIFTAIYRSPIRWVAGHKELLLGAAEMEYTASADGIFQPADIGVLMHSTHGSNAVQPITMGSYVLFPSDNGTKVRSMQYASAEAGWVAPDMTLAHPTVVASGIKRMVRMRNPHQMAIVLTASGQLSILHIDTSQNILGWSKLTLRGLILDVAVQTNAAGFDVLYMVIQRTISGVSKLYLEAIVNWTDTNEYSYKYLQSFVNRFSASPTNTITGLSHLEGQYVQVVTDGNYIGQYLVTGGSITLTNQLGEAITFVNISIGLPMTCSMTTLPLIGRSPHSIKRHTEIVVRTLGSGRPLINGEQPADRDPLAFLGYSQPKDILYDNTVSNMGRDYVIKVEEKTPIRIEVIGIFGSVVDSKI